MKVCKICNENKPDNQFSLIQKKYLNSWCMSCNGKKYDIPAWQKANKEKQASYNKKHRQLRQITDYTAVYLIPEHNYVGVTNNLINRKSWHKTMGKDISGTKILHKFKSRAKALAKEAEYHAMGYAGANLHISSF